jgi:hypothetical protein
VDDCIQVVVGGAEPPQNAAKRIRGWTVGLRPTRGQLNADNGVVTAADSNALAALVAMLAVVVVAGVAAGGVGTLTCGHGAQL